MTNRLTFSIPWLDECTQVTQGEGVYDEPLHFFRSYKFIKIVVLSNAVVPFLSSLHMTAGSPVLPCLK